MKGTFNVHMQVAEGLYILKLHSGHFASVPLKPKAMKAVRRKKQADDKHSIHRSQTYCEGKKTTHKGASSSRTTLLTEQTIDCLKSGWG